MLSILGHRRGSGRRGFTLPEILVVMAVMGAIGYASSMIYFSVLAIHRENIWRLPPYDNATRAAQRVCDELQEAMLIVDHEPAWIVFMIPQKDANRDNVLTLGADGYFLSQGDRIAFYLSDETGAIGAEGNCLWKAVRRQGESVYTPRVKIADEIHPELNPVDPSTGLPHPMFKYWPDIIRLWGVEVWMTSTAVVSNETKTQTAHSESYLRNR